MLYYSFRLRR